MEDGRGDQTPLWVHNDCGGQLRRLSKSQNALTELQRRAITRIDNAIRDHLTPSDLAGALRDMVGNPVRRLMGGHFDHVTELKDTLRGLRKNAKVLENAMDPAARAARERAMEAIRRIEEFVLGAGL